MAVLNYLAENFEMIFELVGLLLLLGISVHISERTKKMTRVIIILLFVESLVFYLERWTQSFENLNPMRPILTAMVYSLYPVILLVLTQIIMPEAVSKKALLIVSIPELICIPIYFTSQWTHWVCWFSEDNHYHSGLLASLPYFIFGFYTLLFIIQNIRYFMKFAGKRKLSLTYFYIVVVPFLGVFYYRYYTNGEDYSSLFSSAILLYYIMIYIHMAGTDPLTSLLNRLSYDIDNRKHITGVLSVDMNGLKKLNDSEGHQAGDKALKTIADILRKCSGRHAYVYRIGGDEFVVLYTGVGEKEIVDSIKAMREEMTKTKYSCAFGYAMLQPGDSLSNAIMKSDSQMYLEKTEYYDNCENRPKGDNVSDEKNS